MYYETENQNDLGIQIESEASEEEQSIDDQQHIQIDGENAYNANREIEV